MLLRLISQRSEGARYDDTVHISRHPMFAFRDQITNNNPLRVPKMCHGILDIV